MSEDFKWLRKVNNAHQRPLAKAIDEATLTHTRSPISNVPSVGVKDFWNNCWTTGIQLQAAITPIGERFYKQWRDGSVLTLMISPQVCRQERTIVTPRNKKTDASIPRVLSPFELNYPGRQMPHYQEYWVHLTWIIHIGYSATSLLTSRSKRRPLDLIDNTEYKWM